MEIPAGRDLGASDDQRLRARERREGCPGTITAAVWEKPAAELLDADLAYYKLVIG